MTGNFEHLATEMIVVQVAEFISTN